MKNYFKFCVSGTGHIKFKLVLKFVHYVGCGNRIMAQIGIVTTCALLMQNSPSNKLNKNQSMGKHQLFQFAGSGPLHNLGFPA